MLYNLTAKQCEGLPDTTIIFDENEIEVDHNPTKKKTKKLKKFGKMSLKALKFVGEYMPEDFKNMVNQSKQFKNKLPK